MCINTGNLLGVEFFILYICIILYNGEKVQSSLYWDLTQYNLKIFKRISWNCKRLVSSPQVRRKVYDHLFVVIHDHTMFVRLLMPQLWELQYIFSGVLSVLRVCDSEKWEKVLKPVMLRTKGLACPWDSNYNSGKFILSLLLPIESFSLSHHI